MAELETMPGPQFDFEYLNKCVAEVMTIRNLPRDKWNIVTARFNDIIEGERARLRRLRDWNKRNATPPGDPGNAD